jgi:hypothetical protein
MNRRLAIAVTLFVVGGTLCLAACGATMSHGAPRGPAVLGPAPVSPQAGRAGINSIAVDQTGRPWISGRATHGAPLVACWTGDEWQRLPDFLTRLHGNVGPVAPVGTDDVWLTARGGSDLIHWDGSTWKRAPLPAKLTGVDFGAFAVVAPNDIWAVGMHIGSYYQDGGRAAAYQPLSLHWDGRSWQVVRVPHVPGRVSGLGAVSAQGGEVWAVGSYEVKTGVRQIEGGGDGTQVVTRDKPLVLRLQNGHWVRVANPDLGSGTELVGVSVLGPGDVWVLGWSTKGPVNAGQLCALVERWDGSAWQEVAGLGSPNQPLGLDSALAARSDTDVWVLGQSTDGSPAVTRWDGTQWTTYKAYRPSASPSPTLPLNSSWNGEGAGSPGIVIDAHGDVWVSTDWTSIPGGPQLWRWDGATWSQVSVPF